MGMPEFIYIGTLLACFLFGWIGGSWYGHKQALKNTKIAVKVTAGKSKGVSKSTSAL